MLGSPRDIGITQVCFIQGKSYLHLGISLIDQQVHVGKVQANWLFSCKTFPTKDQYWTYSSCLSLVHQEGFLDILQQKLEQPIIQINELLELRIMNRF